jgi:hypothetical protein
MLFPGEEFCLLASGEVGRAIQMYSLLLQYEIFRGKYYMSLNSMITVYNIYIAVLLIKAIYAYSFSIRKIKGFCKFKEEYGIYFDIPSIQGIRTIIAAFTMDTARHCSDVTGK